MGILPLSVIPGGRLVFGAAAPASLNPEGGCTKCMPVRNVSFSCKGARRVNSESLGLGPQPGLILNGQFLLAGE